MRGSPRLYRCEDCGAVFPAEEGLIIIVPVDDLPGGELWTLCPTCKGDQLIDSHDIYLWDDQWTIDYFEANDIDYEVDEDDGHINL
ncbi:MAG: hypothetical protein IJO77_05705 [Oscillospiraceae bacterium]|nr:hypothetical protein [Oscillospiraceae bacterium]